MKLLTIIVTLAVLLFTGHSFAYCASCAGNYNGNTYSNYTYGGGYAGTGSHYAPSSGYYPSTYYVGSFYFGNEGFYNSHRQFYAPGCCNAYNNSNYNMRCTGNCLDEDY